MGMAAVKMNAHSEEGRFATTTRLTKKRLFTELFRSIEAGGGQVVSLSDDESFPREVIVSFADGLSTRILVYLWNCTYDRVNARPRFQVTGVDSHRFLIVPGVETFLMGYDQERNVFVAADVSRRKAEFGASPSIYFSEECLESARVNGIASHENTRGETIVALRSDLVSVLFHAPSAVHDIASRHTGSATLERLAKTGAGRRQPTERTRMLVSRAVRDAKFPARLLPLYEHSCAVCGLQLGLVEAAHIIPVSSQTWDDNIDNGIALCVLHHRAYDGGLIVIQRDYSISVNGVQKKALDKLGRSAGMDAFQRNLRAQIVLPALQHERPSPDKLEAGARLRLRR